MNCFLNYGLGPRVNDLRETQITGGYHMSVSHNTAEKIGQTFLFTQSDEIEAGKKTLISTQGIAAKWAASAPYLQSVLRIVAAFMFIQTGTMKLFALPAGIPPDGGTVPLLSQMGLGGVLEVGGGLLLL